MKSICTGLRLFLDCILKLLMFRTNTADDFNKKSEQKAVIDFAVYK